MWPTNLAALLSGGAPPGFEGGDLVAGSLELAAIEMLTAADMSVPAAGGNLVVNTKAAGPYDYVVKQGNQTISAFSAASWFTATEDSRSAFIVVNGNLIINAAQIVTPSVRKLFTVIYVAGTLTVNGGISMTARGAAHGGGVAKATLRISTAVYTAVTNPEVPASGGAAGAEDGTVGAAGTAGGTGGGGGGGRTASLGGTPGAAGTSFSGGPGGGGGRAGSGTAAAGSAGEANGGAGGSGAGWVELTSGRRGGGGGAGNPGGLGGTGGSPGTVGEAGTGGVLIVIATGAVSGSGSCSAAGKDGKEGGEPGTTSVGGGGGSGGGSVTVIGASGTVTVSAAGGLGDVLSTTNPGGNGGAGSARMLLP